MFASFIGSPASGKTTTAALTFAGFKELGIPTEWIPEKARTLIAGWRSMQGLAPGAPMHLDDFSHLTIMKEQYLIEKQMFFATGNEVYLLADGSTLNSLLYMSPKTRELPYVQEAASKAAEMYDVIFYCPPILQQATFDPNRVHTFEQSKEIDSRVHEMLAAFEGKIKAPVIALIGTPVARAAMVKEYLLREGKF